MVHTRVGCFNAQSLVARGRIEELESMLMAKEIQVCLLQETFLKMNHNHRMLNYNLIRSDRINMRGGGTAIAIHKSMDYRRIPIKELAQLRVLEATAILVRGRGGSKLYLISIYNRNDTRRISGELRRLFEVLHLERNENNFIIGGDFNASHSSWGSPNTTARGRELRGFVNDTSPLYSIRIATSVTSSRPLTNAFLDLFLIGRSTLLSPHFADEDVNILPLVNASFSDHQMVILSCQPMDQDEWIPPPPEGRLARLRRGVARIDRVKFVGQCWAQCRRGHLGQRALDEAATRNIDERELDELSENVTEVIVRAMENSMPRSFTPATNRGTYIPKGIKILTQRKRDLMRQLFCAYRSPDRGGWAVAGLITTLRMEVASLRRAIQAEWRRVAWDRDCKLLETVGYCRPGDFFRQLGRFGKESRQEEEEAFLVEDSDRNRVILGSADPIVGEDGRMVVTGPDVQKFLCGKLEETFNPLGGSVLTENDIVHEPKITFSPSMRADECVDPRFISLDALNDLIGGIKNKHSFGPDGVPNSVIRMLPRHLRRLIVVVMNQAINLNSLPRSWKVSTVTFLLKKPNVRGDPSNYRPISLLSSLSKLLEKFFTLRLERELEDKGLLSGNQFGFRRGRSTVDAISVLIDKIQQCRVEDQTAGVIFIDLKKAFDSVDHRLLISKMSGMGISSDLVEFFSGFLQGRRFISSGEMSGVQVAGDLFRVECHRIRAGVLQGSISGPVLFALFINEVITEVGCTVAYADDIALWQGYRDVHELMRRLQNKFNRLQRAIERLRLSINLGKTKIVLFRESLNTMEAQNREWVSGFCIRGLARVDMHGDVVFGDELEVVSSYKYLGVELDEFLKFDRHVEALVKSAQKVGGTFKCLLRRSGVPLDRKLLIYKAVMRPLLTYACPVWLLLTPFLMGKIIKQEYHTLCGIFGRLRRRNGRFWSYRSRISRAGIPGIDYLMIWFTRRYLERLDGKEWTRVNRAEPNWSREMELVRNRCFTTEGFMFLDRLKLIQNSEGKNVFSNINRHGLSGSFNLREAILGINMRRARWPTEEELKICTGEYVWQKWIVPAHYGLS